MNNADEPLSQAATLIAANPGLIRGVGPFRLSHQVGAGGMGVVYRGEDPRTGRAVAIKLLRSDHGGQAHRERFMREASALARLRHPAIVEYIDHGTTEDGRDYLVMEWLGGTTLEAEIRRTRLGVTACIALATRITAALAAAHAQGLVHRDIKPSNIILPDGDMDQAKLVDFGIARERGAQHLLTATGVMLGTLGYMAPEQACGDPDIDGRADLFALGSVLYECLTGEAAFAGEHPMAVLAKILLDNIPDVRILRPEVPPALASLLARLLAKRPEDRPESAEIVGVALAALAHDPGTESVSSPSGLTLQEQRFSSVALVRFEARPTGAAETLIPGAADLHDVLIPLVRRFDAVCQTLPDHTYVISWQLDGPASDVAAQSAHFALAIRSAHPQATVAIASGFAVQVGRSLLGPVIDEAVRIAAAAPASSALVDDNTARLIIDRFSLDARAEGWWLLGEREAMAVRRLLGRPVPFVGRARELGLLLGLFRAAVEETRSGAVLVLAPSGTGKSRLGHEFVQQVCKDFPEVLVLIGRGQLMSGNVAFELLAQAIRREARLESGQPPELQRARLRARLARVLTGDELERVSTQLAALCGLDPRSEDPARSVDGMRLAWLTWIEAELRQRPAILILEDLHWGDAASVALVDATLHQLRSRPLLVLALARDGVLTRFNRLWRDHEVETLQLAPLSSSASERLIHELLGRSADPALVATLVRRADGNAFYLEELIRTASAGLAGELPETVLGMVQARIQVLDENTRRLLRAASVFGSAFSDAGIAAITGEPESTVRRALSVLELQELVIRLPRAEAQSPSLFRFRHALLQEAAYMMLVEEDRVRAHALAAMWLERSDGADPGAVAEHYWRGNERDRALPQFYRAAVLALASGDFDAVIASAEQAIACGAANELLGRLRLLQVATRWWGGDLKDGEHWSREALQLFPEGCAGWYSALRSLIYIATLGDDIDEGLRWLAIGAALGPDASVRDEWILCLCTAIYAVCIAGRVAKEQRLVAELERWIEGETLALAVEAEVLRTRAYICIYSQQTERGLGLTREAAERFTALGDLRMACSLNIVASNCLEHLGDLEAAERSLSALTDLAEKLGAAHLVVYQRTMLSRMFMHRGRLDEAWIGLDRSRHLLLGRRDRRSEGVVRLQLAEYWLLRGDPGQAEAEARCACERLEHQRPFATWGVALLCRSLLEQGKVSEAAALSGTLQAALLELEMVEQQDLVLRTAIACRLAVGDRPGAESLADLALARLRRTLDPIEDPALRDHLRRAPSWRALVADIRALGRAVDGLEDPADAPAV